MGNDVFIYLFIYILILADRQDAKKVKRLLFYYDFVKLYKDASASALRADDFHNVDVCQTLCLLKLEFLFQYKCHEMA